VDYVAMDFKHVPEKYHTVAGVQVDIEKFLESVKILLESNIDYEFRTTVIDGHHTMMDIENIARIISGARHYYLQNYKAGKTLDPKFHGRSFLSRDILQLKKIAQKYIKNVQIRM